MTKRVAALAATMVAVAAAQQPVTTRLEGIVADGRGRPLPTAQVQVERDGVELARTVTDGTGAFALGRLPPGLLVVRAWTDGRAGAQSDLVRAPREVVCIATWPTRTLQVRVRDSSGEPVGGAAVVAAANGEGLEEACARGVTDAAGRCTLRNVVIGSADVRALAGTAPMASATVDGVDDGDVELEIPSAPARHIHVALDGASPAQIAAARLVLHCTDAKQRGEEVMPLPQEPLRLLPDGTLPIDWLPDGVRVGIDLVAADDSFAPASDFVPPYVRKADVRLHAEPCTPTRFHLSQSDGPLAGMTLWVSQGVTRPAVTTDARGEAPALVPQRKKFYVYLLSREWVLQSGDAGEWVEGIGGDACELRAMRRALVTGRVVDAAGKPVPGTVIAIERDDNELDGTRCHATGDGTFSTWLSASSRTGLVLSAHGARGQVRRELPPAGPDGSTRVELALDPPNIATGIIVDGDGKPIAGARLQVSGDRDRSYRTLVSERDGSFALVGHDAVPYVFDVEGAKFERPLGSGVTVLAPLVIDR